jgi:hypothetical protein
MPKDSFGYCTLAYVIIVLKYNAQRFFWALYSGVNHNPYNTRYRYISCVIVWKLVEYSTSLWNTLR